MHNIAVIGSSSDLYSDIEVELAKNLGRIIADSNNYLLYGASNSDTLASIAAREAKKYGGTTIGFTKDNSELKDSPTIKIVTGEEEGGAREFSLISSAKVVIALAGGAGTLNEMTIAYNKNIPIVALSTVEGVAKDYIGKALDKRNTIIVEKADSPEEALDIAIKLASNKQ